MIDSRFLAEATDTEQKTQTGDQRSPEIRDSERGWKC